MIRLVNPLMPPTDRILYHYRQVEKNDQQTNFGQLYHKAKDGLSEVCRGEAIPVPSATVGLELALKTLRLSPGAKVLIPDFTFIATLNAVVRAGFEPVIGPVDPKTWVLDRDKTAQRLMFGDISAIIVVAPFGYFLGTDIWQQVSKAFGIPIVWDLAGAFGFFPGLKGPRVYSFHASKSFTTGEGGCVVFDDPAMAQHAERLINFDADRQKIHSPWGLNGKISELQCAIILAGLEDDHLRAVYAKIAHKRRLLAYYRSQLPSLYEPMGAKTPSLCVFGNASPAKLWPLGRRAGIEIRPYYRLLSDEPALGEFETVAEPAPQMRTCVALPSDVRLGEADRVIELIQESKGRNRDRNDANLDRGRW
jgi:dTDP-4-amino-4,6-dideoxygalactose transaminase